MTADTTLTTTAIFRARSSWFWSRVGAAVAMLDLRASWVANVMTAPISARTTRAMTTRAAFTTEAGGGPWVGSSPIASGIDG